MKTSSKRIKNVFNVLNGVPNSSLVWFPYFRIAWIEDVGRCGGQQGIALGFSIWIDQSDKLCCVLLHCHIVSHWVLMYLVPIQQHLLMADPTLVVDLPCQLCAKVPINLCVLLDVHDVPVRGMRPHSYEGDQLVTDMAFVCAVIRHVVTVHTGVEDVGGGGWWWVGAWAFSI